MALKEILANRIRESCGKKYFSGDCSEKIMAEEIDFHMSFKFTALQPGFLNFNLSPFFIRLSVKNQFLSISRAHPGNIIESSFVKLHRDDENGISLKYAKGRIIAIVNSQTLEFSSKYSPLINILGLHCDGEIEIRNCSIYHIEAKTVPHTVPSHKFDIDMTTDIYSDMMPASWSRAMLGQYMQINRSLGIRRINWIYHGNKSDGFWDFNDMPWRENIRQTQRKLGDSFFKVAVEEAHKSGLQIYAVFKPFDMGIDTFTVKDALVDKKMPALGGYIPHRFHFPAENPELCMQRLPVKSGVPAKIVLNYKSDLSALHGFKLWVSNDNRHYQDTGKISYPEAISRTVTFDVTACPEKYFAVQSLSEPEKNNVYNTQKDFIKLYDKNGDEIDFTLSFVPRWYLADVKNHKGPRTYDYGKGFAGEGFIFDFFPGIPSAIWCGDFCSKRLASLNFEEGVVGIAAGVNPWVPGVMCPAEKKTREYWLKIVNDIINYGADGVDIRISNHSSVFGWDKYGFNPVIREEYRKRHEIDPATSHYDKEKLRILRGEFYTLFLEEAAKLVHENGRRLAIHIPDMAFGTPDASTMMELDWNWKEWIEKGIPDEVTLKCLYPESPFTHTARELLQLCQNRKIPVTVSPFINLKIDFEEHLNSLRNLGFSAFNVYESATLWKAGDNNLEALHPEFLKKILDLTGYAGI
jgi:hypothetical protein